MSIFIQGQTACPICGNVITDETAALTLSNMEANTKSPLWQISGSMVHRHCYESSSLRSEIDRRLLLLDKLDNQAPVDFISGLPLTLLNIGHPDNIVGTGFLTDDKRSPLYQYNLVSFNRKNLKTWDQLPALLGALEDLDASGSWGGKALRNLINNLQAPPKSDLDPALLERRAQRSK